VSALPGPGIGPTSEEVVSSAAPEAEAVPSSLHAASCSPATNDALTSAGVLGTGVNPRRSLRLEAMTADYEPKVPYERPDNVPGWHGLARACAAFHGCVSAIARNVDSR
jgi:hypothetical protein